MELYISPRSIHLPVVFHRSRPQSRLRLGMLIRHGRALTLNQATMCTTVRSEVPPHRLPTTPGPLLYHMYLLPFQGSPTLQKSSANVPVGRNWPPMAKVTKRTQSQSTITTGLQSGRAITFSHNDGALFTLACCLVCDIFP